MKICGVRFKRVGKIYYFDPGDKSFELGEKVVVETSRGIELGEIAIPEKEVDPDSLRELKPVLRKAAESDIQKAKDNIKSAEEAMEICRRKIAQHKLDMKLIDCEYTFDNSKVLFYFTSDGRVDFRELVKDLASVFRMRIELRQIGVRDEAKMKGGLGICGQPFCCSTHLSDFHPVSIKMAKEQGLSLNPTKISGTCGRLMCCLKYEQAAYDALLKITPKAGALVDTPSGQGVVTEANLLTGDLKVKVGRENDTELKSYKRDEVRIIKDSTIRIDKNERELLAGLEE